MGVLKNKVVLDPLLNIKVPAPTSKASVPLNGKPPIPTLSFAGAPLP